MQQTCATCVKKNVCVYTNDFVALQEDVVKKIEKYNNIFKVKLLCNEYIPDLH